MFSNEVDSDAEDSEGTAAKVIVSPASAEPQAVRMEAVTPAAARATALRRTVFLDMRGLSGFRAVVAGPCPGLTGRWPGDVRDRSGESERSRRVHIALCAPAIQLV